MSSARRVGLVCVVLVAVLCAAGQWSAAELAIESVEIVAPAGSTEVPQYDKIELKVTLSGVTATQLYDADPANQGLDLSATFSGPGGTWQVNGFYDGTDWLIRFAPNATGAWAFAVNAADPGGTAAWTGGSFACVPSTHKGWARIDGHFLRFATGQVAFAVGHNTGWQDGPEGVEVPTLAEMASRGENLLSFWLATPWDDPAWEVPERTARAPIENAHQGIGNYNQGACAYLDGVVARAEAAGVCLLPTIWSHGQLRDEGHPWGDGWWDNNAYNEVCSATAFFDTNGTEQWRLQRNLYRYLIARWGYSRAIAGWVGLCEADGTTGFVSNRSQTEAWCDGVLAYFKANDPFRAAADGYPIAFSKLDDPSWKSGFDFRTTDSYSQQRNNTNVASTIASQTQTMRGSGQPCFHAEFGGDTVNGASQPTHLHNGIWAGAAAGAAMSPLVWCDGGNFPMLTADMQSHLEILDDFMDGINYLGATDLSAASISFTGSFYRYYHRGWGMKTADRGYVWIQNTRRDVGNTTLNVSGLAPGDYTVEWYNVWTSGATPVQTNVIACSGTLSAAIPSIGRRDVAVKFQIVGANAPPVADDQQVATNEDTALAITLTATDPDGDPLTFAIVNGPANGSLSGTPPNVVYTPAANYSGADIFTFKANDGQADSNVATVSITVNPVNDAPVANPQSVATNEDTPVAITLTGSDADGDTLTYAVGDGPSHGSLSGTAPAFTYMPAADYSGPDSFAFTVSDGTVDSDPATVSINVTSVNDPPVAANDSYGATEDVQLVIAAPGVLGNDSDPEGAGLSAILVSGASRGALVLGGDGSFTYTPNPNANGGDSFTYKANDGTDNSNVATVTIDVAPVNDNPDAVDDNASTQENIPVVIAVLVNDTDPDGDTLTVSDLGTPSDGDVTNNGDGTITYTPDPGFTGSDSFTYTASDGHGGQDVALVHITVTEVNHPPVADDQAVVTNEDTAVGIVLTASDQDIDPLTYTIVAGPTDGVLSGAAPDLTYTPNANYHGADSFTFKANDGKADSNVATVSITVSPINDAPVADDQAVGTNEDTAIAIALSGSDPDGDPIASYSVASQPANGTLSGTAPSLTYTPDPNWYGEDSFTFTVSDGTVDSAPATVTITVASVNDLPEASDQAVETDEDTPVAIALVASDVETPTLTYPIVAQPAHGSLSGTAPNLTYTPDANWSGADTFTFKANDGEADSNVATVSITVNAVDDAPVANDQNVETDEDSPLAITLAATDGDGDDLTYAVLDPPDHGSLTGAPLSLTYTPDADYNGADSFTFKANDGGLDSNIATVSITINAVNDAPVADGQSVTTDEDTPVAVTLTASDIDSGTLTFSVVAQPAHGSLSGTAPNLTYTPDANWSGADTFTFKANDGEADSNVATVSITIGPVNDAPVAAADAYNVDQDDALNVAAPGVLGNDSDVDGDGLSAVLATGPSNGQLTLNADGSFTYTPNQGFSGADSFTYRASDGSAQSAPATVTIAVNPSALTAAIAIDMSVQAFWKFWRCTATVTVKDPSGAPIAGATVEGHWGGVYSGNVSGTTDGAGADDWRTGWIRSSGTLTFTVDRVSKDGQDYTLSGETTDQVTR